MKKEFDFEGMQDTARQIESLAFLLRMAAETGQLENADDGSITEDTAILIQEKARDLGMMMLQAKDAAQDLPAE